MKHIAESTVRRLSLYLRFLEEHDARGNTTISSGDLARFGGTTSAQVRKDLSFFGSFGKRGMGYAVKDLITAIREILGLGRNWTVVIIGAGKIGAALASWWGWDLAAGLVFGLAMSVASTVVLLRALEQRNELDTQLVMLTLEGLCNGASLQARLATRVVATEWLQLTSGFLVPECPSGLQSLTLYVEGPPAFKNLLVDDVSLRQVTLSGEAEQTSSPTSPSCTGASGHAASNGNGNSDSNPSCNGNPGS